MNSSDSNEVKALLKDVFTKFDKNKNGLIDIQEAAAIFKEVGQDISQTELKDFFNSIDKNHDGELSFDELYSWFTHKSKGGHMSVQDKVKFKLLNAFKSAQKEISKVSTALKDESHGMDVHHIEVSIGNVTNPKTQFDVKLTFGAGADSAFEPFSKGLDLDDNLGVVIQFKSNDPHSAKDELLSVLNDAKGMAQMMAPPGVDLESVGFTAGVDGNNINIGVKYTHPLTGAVTGQYDMIVNSVLPDEFTSTVNFEINASKNIEDIFDEDITGGNPKNIASHLLSGCNIVFEAKFAGSVLKALRSQWLGMMPWQSMPKPLKALMPLLLISGSKIKLNFKEKDAEWYQQMIQDSSFSLASLVGMAGNIPLDQFLEMAPPLASFLDTAYNKLEGEFTIALKGPRTLITVHVKSAGMKKVWSKIRGL